MCTCRRAPTNHCCRQCNTGLRTASDRRSVLSGVRLCRAESRDNRRGHHGRRIVELRARSGGAVQRRLSHVHRSPAVLHDLRCARPHANRWRLPQPTVSRAAMSSKRVTSSAQPLTSRFMAQFLLAQALLRRSSLTEPHMFMLTMCRYCALRMVRKCSVSGPM